MMAVIILEEDLEVSSDFFSYFEARSDVQMQFEVQTGIQIAYKPGTVPKCSTEALERLRKDTFL